MPLRPKVELVFGGGLDRETGVMATQPASFEDLRNVVLFRGKAQTRKGLESMLTFANTTHIVAIQALRSESAGMIVTYDSATGDVNIWRVDADATSATLIGLWFNHGAGSDAPIVQTAEMSDKVFFAHASSSQFNRAQTFMYDPSGIPVLSGLEADFDGFGLAPIRFAGVVSHLEYLFGWGFGTASLSRPEMVRVSQPGEPNVFNLNHYIIAGDRRDPVITCVPFSATLGVWKNSLTFEIFGFDRASFGIRRIDPLYGCIGPRLATNVAGSVFFWSEIGPRFNFGGGSSQDAAQPLDVFGFEPETLVQEGSSAQAFSGFIRDIRALFFAFNKRLYVMFLRGGLANAKWCYWELGVDVFSAGPLFPSSTVVLTAPTGHPECTTEPVRGAGIVTVNWENVGLTGDEIVEIWYRAISVVTPNPNLNIDVDTPTGIADGWTKVEDAQHTVTFTVVSATGQEVDVTATSDGAVNNSGLEFVIDNVLPGAEVELRVTRQRLSGDGHLHWGFEFRDNVDAVISTVETDNDTPATLTTDTLQGTAPALTDDVRVFLYAVTDDIAEVVKALYSGAFGVFPLVAGPWQAVAVEANGQATQSLGIPLADNTDWEFALRYRRGPLYTAGYESSDPLDWPEISRCPMISVLTAPTIIVSTMPISQDLAATGSRWFASPVASEGLVVLHVLKTVVGADIEIHRQLDGESVPTLFFGPIAGFEAPAINFIPDATLSGEEETDVQYFAKHVVAGSTTSSPLSAAYVQWVGPHSEPGISPLEFIAFQRGVSGEVIVSTSYNWIRDAANDTFTIVEWEIEANINSGGYNVVATLSADAGQIGATKQFTGLTPTDSILYRSRHKHTVGSDISYSKYSVVSGPVIVP